MSMGHREDHGLGAVFCDAVVVVLINPAQVSSWPSKGPVAHDSLQVQRDLRTRRVVIPLQCKRRPPNQY
jgi:hypothetical protein